MRKQLIIASFMVLGGCAHDHVVTRNVNVYMYPPRVECPEDEARLKKDPNLPSFMEKDIQDYIISLRTVLSVCSASVKQQNKVMDDMKEREKRDADAIKAISPKTEDKPTSFLFDGNMKGAVDLASL